MAAGEGRIGSKWVWFGFDLIRHEFIDTEEHWIFTDALKGKRKGGEIGWGFLGDWDGVFPLNWRMFRGFAAWGKNRDCRSKPKGV